MNLASGGVVDDLNNGGVVESRSRLVLAASLAFAVVTSRRRNVATLSTAHDRAPRLARRLGGARGAGRTPGGRRCDDATQRPPWIALERAGIAAFPSTKFPPYGRNFVVPHEVGPSGTEGDGSPGVARGGVGA